METFIRDMTFKDSEKHSLQLICLDKIVKHADIKINNAFTKS
jgi:hypothetical protein